MTAIRTSTKLQKLLALYDAFHASVAEIPGDYAQSLNYNWKQARGSYETPPTEVRPSQLASGLEEALREMPMLFNAAAPEERSKFNRAFFQALEEHYPDFLKKQQERFEKILSKGKISRESEYYIIRHYVDIYESNEKFSSLLTLLYQLIDVYECAR